MNYPNGIKTNSSFKTSKIKQKQASKSHLGLGFEALINKSNSFYLLNNICIVYKKPTPIRVVKVSYPARSKAKIIEAYYQIPSTTDYNGIYKGKYIDFEAKSINGKSFPFTNLYPHQIEHLKKVYQHGGISFLLILFNDFQEIFLLSTNLLIDLYEKANNGERKSIPYSFFKNNAEKVNMSYNVPVDYINVIERLYF